MRHALLPALTILLIGCGTSPSSVDPGDGDAGSDAGSGSSVPDRADASSDARADDGGMGDSGVTDAADGAGHADTVSGTDADASTPGGDTLVEGCVLEQDWWNPDRPIWASGGFFGLQPGSALVHSADDAHSFHRALSLSDGASYLPVASGELLDIAANGAEGLWLRRGEVLEASLVRTVLAGGAPDVLIPAVEGWEWVAGALGSRTQVYVRCEVTTGERFIVEARRAEAVVAEVELEGTCQAWGGVRPRVALSADDSVAWVAFDDTLVQLDLATGDAAVIYTAPPIDGARGAIPAIDAHPLENWVAFSSTDNQVRVLDADGDPQIEPLPADAVFANRWTFATLRWVSPVRWSPDGQLLAFALERESLSVLEVATGRYIMTTTPGGRAGSDLGVPQDVESFAVDVAFTSDGTAVVVDFIDGTSMVSCADAATFEVPTRIDAAIGGPRTIAVGEQANWMAEIRGALPLLAADFRVDGQAMGVPASIPTVFHRPETAGEFTLTLRLHDGFGAGSAELVVVAE